MDDREINRQEVSRGKCKSKDAERRKDAQRRDDEHVGVIMSL